MSGTLAVVSQTGQSLSFFDLSSGERTAHMTGLISEPHELLLDSKRNILYLSHAYHHGNFWVHGEAGHQISVIDPVKKEVVDLIDIAPARGPHGLVLDAKRDLLWCSYEEHDNASGGLVGIDLITRKVVRQVESSTKTHWFAMTPDGKKAYTCNKTAEFISILDLENERMVGKIDAPGTEECSISLDGKFAYFPTPGTKFGVRPEKPLVMVIDTATDKVVTTIPLELGALSTHVAGDGKIMVGQYRFDTRGPKTDLERMIKEGRLSVYEPNTHKHYGGVDIGKIPLTMRSSPDGKLGFVANIHAGTVSVVDMSKMTVLKTLTVDTRFREISNMCQGAHGMVYFP